MLGHERGEHLVVGDQLVGRVGVLPRGHGCTATAWQDACMAQPPEMQIDETTVYRVTIATDRGDIVMDLDPRLAPRSVNNFVVLARDGYYDGLTFHRVEPGFVIQGGCPEGSGRGAARLQVRRRAGAG